MTRKLHNTPLNVGEIVKKVGRPDAPLAKVLSVNGDKLSIEYVETGEIVETFGIDLDGYDRYEHPTYPEYKKVIFNAPYTIVIWPDDTKTVVKAMKGDKFDEATGLAMALIKKMYGGTGILKKVVKDTKKAAKKAIEEANAKALAKMKAKEVAEAKAKAKADEVEAKKAAEEAAKLREDRIAAALEKLAETNEVKAETKVEKED